MAFVELDLRPPSGRLRMFGLALAAVLLWLAWQTLWMVALAAILAAGLALLWPSGLRWVYVAMLLLAYPVGFAVSWVVLGAAYYGVVTPVGLIARLCGRDKLLLHRPGNQRTYWVARKPPPPSESYFHQW